MERGGLGEGGVRKGIASAQGVGEVRRVEADSQQEPPAVKHPAPADGVAAVLVGMFVGGTACAVAAWTIIHGNPALAETLLEANHEVFKALHWKWGAAHPEILLGYQILGGSGVAGAGLSYFLWKDLRSR